MTEPSEAPQIPQSSALAEATPDSLGELLSRDPEGYSNLDLARVIEVFRAQRHRWAAAEAQGKTKGESAKRVLAAPLKQIATGAAEDLDL